MREIRYIILNPNIMPTTPNSSVCTVFRGFAGHAFAPADNPTLRVAVEMVDKSGVKLPATSGSANATVLDNAGGSMQDADKGACYF